MVKMVDIIIIRLDAASQVLGGAEQNPRSAWESEGDLGDPGEICAEPSSQLGSSCTVILGIFLRKYSTNLPGPNRSFQQRSFCS